MRSLFWKIFCYFLLIIILIGSVGVTLTLLRDQEFPPLAHQNFARRAIAEYGRDVVTAHDKDGYAGVDAYIEKLRRESGIDLMVLDQQGRSLSNRQSTAAHASYDVACHGQWRDRPADDGQS